MRKNISQCLRNVKLITQIMLLFIISIGLAYYIKIFIDYRTGMSLLLNDKSEEYEALADYLVHTMEEYNNMPWLFDYWYSHYDEMDIIYDDKEATKQKHEEFHSRNPKIDIHSVSEETLTSLSKADRKLYAECEYMDWIDLFDSLKKSYKPTFMSCACLMEDGYSRFYYLSGADEGQTRGHGKTDVYVLGSIFESNSNAQSLWDAAWNECERQTQFKDMGSGYYHIYIPYVHEGKPVCVTDITVQIDTAKERWKNQLMYMEIYAVIPFVVCALLLVIFLKRFVIRPVDILSGAMKKYQADRDPEEIRSELESIAGKNEIGTLSGNFINMASETSEHIRQIRSLSSEKEQLLTQTVMALANTVDAKDNYTSGHSRRVAEYAKMIAGRMGKSIEEQEEIYRAGLLHDVGKIRIPEEIINKPAKLTDDEFAFIKLHPITGYHILKGVDYEKVFADGARFHHERYDGKGYPIGLAGTQIPEIARIIGIADAYDAMASRRSYRETMTQEAVRSEIEKGKGTQFDPDIADIMLALIDEDKDYTMKETKPAQKRILAVDDEAMNIKLLTFALKDVDYYTVTGAESGEKAIEALRRSQYDVAFIDLKMPDMNGYETAEKIREFSDIPIVLMTVDKHSIDIDELKKYDITDFVSKPFTPSVIKEIIHAVFTE